MLGACTSAFVGACDACMHASISVRMYVRKVHTCVHLRIYALGDDLRQIMPGGVSEAMFVKTI